MLLKNEILSSLKSELKISNENFNKIIEKGLTLPLHFQAFNQLKIIEDFEIFKKILMVRNEKFNQEALDSLQEKEKNKKTKNIENERENNEEFEKAVKESLELQKQISQQQEKELEELEEALMLSKKEYEEQGSKMSRYFEKGTNEPLSDHKTNNQIKNHEKNIFKIKSKNNEQGIILLNYSILMNIFESLLESYLVK